MNFDEPVDRRGTNSKKWDDMERFTGVSSDDGLAMWIADMDFRAPEFIQAAIRRLMENGNYGYFSGIPAYQEAVCWWMKTRHGWSVDPDWISTTYGLGNGVALALETFSSPGDGVIIFTPVYHEFPMLIKKAGRQVVELPLQLVDGLYEMDFESYGPMLTGHEKIVLISSPHNPAGRVWTLKELRDLADFCQRNKLLLSSDEIHNDLVFQGNRHIPMHLAAPEIADRLIMMTSASKTFNLAGTRTGNVIIPDAKLRQMFTKRLSMLSFAPNLFGVVLMQAAYSVEGGHWVDELVSYLDGNRKLFDRRVNAIPGLKSMAMQSTYLAWVNFADTGMEMNEINKRVAVNARIATSPGLPMGRGGENYLRFNLGTQRAILIEALDRLEHAFSDLQ